MIAIGFGTGAIGLFLLLLLGMLIMAIVLIVFQFKMLNRLKQAQIAHFHPALEKAHSMFLIYMIVLVINIFISNVDYLSQLGEIAEIIFLFLTYTALNKYCKEMIEMRGKVIGYTTFSNSNLRKSHHFTEL